MASNFGGLKCWTFGKQPQVSRLQFFKWNLFQLSWQMEMAIQYIQMAFLGGFCCVTSSVVSQQMPFEMKLLV